MMTDGREGKKRGEHLKSEASGFFFFLIFWAPDKIGKNHAKTSERASRSNIRRGNH